MAVANVPPGMAAAMDRAKAERDAMNSPDPVTRYRAKDNAKAAEQQELEAQRFEREYYKYKK